MRLLQVSSTFMGIPMISAYRNNHKVASFLLFANTLTSWKVHREKREEFEFIDYVDRFFIWSLVFYLLSTVELDAYTRKISLFTLFLNLVRIRTKGNVRLFIHVLMHSFGSYSAYKATEILNSGNIF